MNNSSKPSVRASGTNEYSVYGTVRDQYQRPMNGVMVKAFDEDIRGEQPLGRRTRTDDRGAYKIAYTRTQFAKTDKSAADIVVRAYGRGGKLLKESGTTFNAPAELQVDIDLSPAPYPGPSEFEQTVESIKPFVGRLPLSQLKEDSEHQDISFLTSKSGLARATIETLAMAFRFEKSTKIEASVFYGLIRQGPPNNALASVASFSSATTFDSKASQTYGVLMREGVDALMTGVQGAVASNIIPYCVTADLPKIGKELSAAQRRYLKGNPQPQASSNLTMKLNIAGLQGAQISNFTKLFAANAGSQQALWTSLAADPMFQTQKVALLQSVFSLSQLTGEQVVLTDELIKSENIQSPADLPKLAAYTSQTWAGILQAKNIQPPAGVPGQGSAEQTQNYAVQLEQNFTARFPSAALTSRIQADSQSKIPNAAAIGQFLNANPQFDLLNTRIGQYLQSTPPTTGGQPTPGPAAPGTTGPSAATAPATAGSVARAVPTGSGTQFVNQLKRVQRVFKLSPTYASTNLLLGDNIDSAHKIHRMGRGNFVSKYGPTLGTAESEQIFQKATQAHSQALMLMGNLKSMSDASYVNVFPNYTGVIADAMTVEVPDLDTLFGHTDFCECQECESVYGAAAYLSDILHYTDNRVTSINYAPGENASVKQALLRRRPDIGDIDLECKNVNVEIPHIDRAIEIMEDFVLSPKVTLNSTFLPKFAAGPIDGGLLAEILSQLNNPAFDLSNVAALLTANATISDKYQAERLQDDDTMVVEDHWIIRDKFVVLKATDLGGSGISVQLVRQTLITSDEISANPEYVNIPTYASLSSVKRPWGLPFDLFETEGELYLEKLGTKKSDLIDAFRKEHIPPGPPSQADLDVAYAYLRVREGERDLIFVQDLLNQGTYWGNLASSTSVELDLFMDFTGLEYGQVLELMNLKTINPLGDSIILSDDLSCDTNTKFVANLTSAKFDIIHRFLRLWKKTTFTLEEFDAIVQAPALGNGIIAPTLAWQLQAFLLLQNAWSLSAFQLLAFYQDLDITPVPADADTENLYNELFQNRIATNPLNPDFAIAEVLVGSMAITDIHKGVIIGALGLAPGDLDTLIAKTDGMLSLGNLSYFFRASQLSQALSLSVGDMLVILDLINIQGCADPTITTPPSADPATTNRFYSKWRTVVSSGFTAGDLNYVLRQQNDSSGSLVTSDDLVAAALGDLQGKLLQVQASTSVPDDPNGQNLKKWLADPVLNWNSNLVDKLMDILGTQDDTEYQQKIDNNPSFLLNLRIQYHDQVLSADLSSLPTMPAGQTFPDLLPGGLASQVSYDADNKLLLLFGYLSSTDQATLKGLPGLSGNLAAYQGAVDQLYNAQQTSNAADNVFFTDAADITNNLRSLLLSPNPLPTPPPQIGERYDWFLTKISPKYAAIKQQNLVQNEICTWFKINKGIATAIENSQPGIYTDFTDPVFVSKANQLTPLSYPKQFNWYQGIAKICFIAGKLKLSVDDLTWFLAHPSDIDSLDFWSLPIAPLAGPVTTFDSFEVVINILKFEQKFPAISEVSSTATQTISVYTVIGDAISGEPVDSIETDLCSLTGWDPTQLDQLINAPTNYLNLTLPPNPDPDLKDIRILLRLQRCFTIMDSMEVTAADCAAWIEPSLSYEDTARIKQALKAQNEEDEWLTISQPLQDTLRQAKRDALVAYLIANPPAGQTWTDSDDLYDYFLIDPEINPCQPTSRIVQATISVQQFVQRCFLHLEDDINVDLTLDPDWSQWQWMKDFRVWQANVKVFLYPENWIQPELLPAEIKSQFFNELENDILQNDVTIDNVETAFLNYMEKLDGVSRLEIKAMWYEDEKSTLHVVGRTYGGDPKIYYYRQFVDNRRWTPWVKIDQDIASDHIVLTVFNHRIYLFWAMFSEKSNDITTISVPNPDTQYTVDQPPKYWQIQMAFTEYKNGKWTPKKVSNADATGWIIVGPFYDNNSQPYIPDKSDFVFTPLDIPEFSIRSYLNANGEPADPSNFLADILADIESSLEGNGDLRINCYLQNTDQGVGSYSYQGTFDLDPCKGYPVCVFDQKDLRVVLFDRSQFVSMLDSEQNAATPDALGVNNAAILNQTPTMFNNLIPLQMGFIDRLINIIYNILFDLYYRGPREIEDDRDVVPVTVGTFMPYFYQDQYNTYFVQPEISDNADFEFAYQDLENLFMAVLSQNTNQVQQILGTFPQGKQLYILNHFHNCYHPLVCFFMRTLFDKGIDALMSRDTQLKNDVIFDNASTFDFNQTYQPTALVYSGAPVNYTLPDGSTVTDQNPGYPKGDVEFDPTDAYSLYNWEMFFHAPLMLAGRLSLNQQWDDAEHVFGWIFNPTDGSNNPSPDKYWVTKPFFINVNDKYTQQNIQNIMLGINSKDSALLQDVTDWRNNPFEPHYIAQYRTVAYQKTTVMKYLDYLIARADSQYLLHTMESVFAAEQLYVLASKILGPKPLVIPRAYVMPIDNYYQLEEKLDAFSNALVDIENLLPLQQVSGYDGTTATQGLPSLETLYFCIPPNDKLMGYYDTVESRLYNIRNCLTLGGQFSPLALFAPPIDPGLLVRAAAAGLDIGSVLSDMNSPLPNYRFTVMVQKAVELCNEVKSLGAALLQAMEKKDAEDLALLRSSNGISILNAVLQVKKQQVDESNHNLEALQAQSTLVKARIDYYQGLISGGLSNWETVSLALTQTAIAGEQSAVVIEYLGNVLSMIPDLNFGAEGFGGSPTATVKFGGQQLGESMRAMAGAIRGTAGVMHSQASVASTQATFERRKQEWQFQLTLANDELQQVAKQILAATVRQAIANQEVENQQLQIANSQAEDDFMHNKFTNSDLYAWMLGQISTIYFQSYQLAYGLAKQAEQTFRYELALGDSSYINFGYWDSLQKGLLAGDLLMYDIRNMDKAYHDQNLREFELTKHVSLSQLDPSALQQLKTNNECWINLPEELFDMDYPGHYMRRFKSVSLTIPCVSGPYTSVSCTLTMSRNSMRVNNTSKGPSNYSRMTTGGVPADDPRFRDAIGAIQSIATSSAQRDSGLHELNLRDERYLPFEGAGVISQWHLQLPAAARQFDYSTISDVVMHLQYTSRDGGDQLRADGTANLSTKINSMLVALKDTGLMRAFSAKHEFPTEWYAFLNPAASTNDQVLTLEIGQERFPYFASVATIGITSVEFIADIADPSLTSISGLQVAPAPNIPLKLVQNGFGVMPCGEAAYATKQGPGTWTLTNPAANPRLTDNQLNDLIVIVHYQLA